MDVRRTNNTPYSASTRNCCVYVSFYWSSYSALHFLIKKLYKGSRFKKNISQHYPDFIQSFDKTQFIQIFIPIMWFWAQLIYKLVCLKTLLTYFDTSKGLYNSGNHTSGGPPVGVKAIAASRDVGNCIRYLDIMWPQFCSNQPAQY